MTLTDKYLIPPISILDVKQGYWKKRRKEWLSLGIEENAGRQDNLLGFSKLLEKKTSSTSIFDPVLSEAIILWFSKVGDKILDCFAGGPVRGIVASKLNRNYYGVDLLKDQIKQNISEADRLCNINKPNYFYGDSLEIQNLVNGKFNMLFSCPPYFNLEVYSDDERDLSNMNYDKFLESYQNIINKSVQLLEDNSFAIFVVGEVREKTPLGKNIGFVKDTIGCFLNSGCVFYNEMILLQEPATAAMRSNRFMESSRKIAKCHQNVLVFAKGCPKKAATRLGSVEKINIEF